MRTPRRRSSMHDEAVDVHLADSLAALEIEVVRAAQTDRGYRQRAPASRVWRWRWRCPAPRSAWWRASGASASSWSGCCARGGGRERARGAGAGGGVGRGVADTRPGDRTGARGAAGGARVRRAAAADWRNAGRLARQTDPAQEDAAGRAAAMLGLRRMEVRRISPYEGARDHHLHVFEKVAETPVAVSAAGGSRPQAPAGLLRDLS